MLTGIVNSIRPVYPELAAKIKVDPVEFVKENICSLQSFECCSSECQECSYAEYTHELLSVLEQTDEVAYARWIHKNNQYQKMEMIGSGVDIAIQLQNLLNKNLKLHIYNIFRQYSQIKYLKQNLKSNEVILSVDFSRNYNKQKHEIQSAYFGHEAFTTYTAACHSKEFINDQSETDLDSGLNFLSVGIISNETVPKRNTAIACNLKLLEVVQHQLKHIKTKHFWSDGCSSQFRSQYTFQSLCLYPADIKLFWDYGEAHHFKGPHDGIGGCIKRKVYQDVLAGKIIISDAQQFAEYANSIIKTHVLYLDKLMIISHNLNSAIYVKGTSKIHHVERINLNKIDVYYNSPYKQQAEKLTTVTYGECSDESDVEEESGLSAEHNELKNTINPLAGCLVVLKYKVARKALRYLGPVQNIDENEFCYIHFLKKSGETTFTIKVGDTDMITKDKIIKVIDAVNHKVNNRGQYIVNYLATNLDM